MLHTKISRSISSPGVEDAVLAMEGCLMYWIRKLHLFKSCVISGSVSFSFSLSWPIILAMLTYLFTSSYVPFAINMPWKCNVKSRKNAYWKYYSYHQPDEKLNISLICIILFKVKMLYLVQSNLNCSCCWIVLIIPVGVLEIWKFLHEMIYSKRISPNVKFHKCLFCI